MRGLKHITIAFILSVFIFSVYVAALSAENVQNAAIKGTAAVSTATAAIDKEVNAYKSLGGNMSVEQCTKRVLDKYPNLNRAVVQTRCQQLLRLVHAADNNQDPNGVNNTEPRYARCVAFLNNYTDVDDPNAECIKLAARERDCVDFLTEHNIKNPVRECDRLFVAAASVVRQRLNIAQQLAEKIPEWRVRTLNRVLMNDSDKVVSAAQDFINNLPDDKVDVFLHLPRADQKRILAAKAVGLLNNYTLRKVNITALYRRRVVAQGTVKMLENRFQAATNAFVQARNFHAEKNMQWLEAKQRLKECKDVDSEKCRQLENESIEKAKEFLLNSIDIISAHLDQIKAKVEASETMDQDDVDEIVDAIDDWNAQLRNASLQVNASTTKDEVKEAARNIERIWRMTRYNAVAFAAHLINGGVHVIIEKSERLEDRVDCAIAKVEDAGKNTDELNSMADNFSDKVSAAKDDWGNAQNLYKEIRTLRITNTQGQNSDEIQEKAEEMSQYIRDANDDLKEAHTLFVNIYREISAQGVDVSSCRDPGLADGEEYVVEDVNSAGDDGNDYTNQEASQ